MFSRRRASILLAVALWAPQVRGQTTAPVSQASPARTAARDHWAFRPPLLPPIPAVRAADWPRSPVDFFILAKLEEKGLAPAPEADRRALIRRVTYDLTGLPPTFEEVEAFAGDPSEEAYEKVVSRLLASPRHGERWGRHWLDVARFADTKGYVYGDREERRFVHSNVYRDWVIQALNTDMPYDRFLLEQIAADQLHPAEAGASDELAAMGFLTLGRRFLGVIHDIIDDRIDTLMRGTQALTVSCARCHDHKFDPIPTRDYYSLYGIFQGSSERIVRLPDAPPHPEQLAAYDEERAKRVAALQTKFQEKLAELTERLRAKAADYLTAVLDVERLHTEEFYSILGPDDLNPVIVRQWQAYLFQTQKTFHPVLALWNALAALDVASFPPRAAAEIERLGPQSNPLVARAFAAAPPRSMRDVARVYGELLAGTRSRWQEAVEAAGKAKAEPPGRLLDPADEELRQVLYGPDSPANVPKGSINEMEWFFDEPTRVEVDKLQAKIEALAIESQGAPPHAMILEDRPVQRNARVFLRGNPAQKGEEAPRQGLELLSGPGRKPFQVGSGRLELARIIASRENPLTARVIVNRVWMHHFGAGIVRTPSDFGMRSEAPSHPELLDWLAVRFMDDGWSLKSLHRLIVLSSTYRQACDANGAAAAADPENRLLAHAARSRLDFESMRDTLLAASGDLDLSMGGRGSDLFTEPFLRRRTVYGLVDRQFLPGTLRVFDFANPDQHTPERHLTTVPQQALFLLNSPFVLEKARGLANRTAGDDEARIREIYRVVYQREPTARQVETGRRFLAVEEAGRSRAWEQYAQALLLSNELVFVD